MVRVKTILAQLESIKDRFDAIEDLDINEEKTVLFAFETGTVVDLKEEEE